MARRQAKARSRITFFETLIAASIVVVLAGITVPRTEGSQEDAETRSILRLTERMTAACTRYLSDTGSYARESVRGLHHDLTIPNQTLGWRGGYLPAPLTRGDNPFGGAIELLNTTDAGGVNPDTGFRRLGTGRPLQTGPAHVLRLTRVPQTIAMLIDRQLDPEVQGMWSHCGHVEYLPEVDEGTLLILLRDEVSGL